MRAAVVLLLVCALAAPAVRACPTDGAGTPPADLKKAYSGEMTLSAMLKSMLTMKKVQLPSTPTIPITVTMAEGGGQMHIDSPMLSAFTLTGAITWCAGGALDFKIDEKSAAGLPVNPVKGRFQVVDKATSLLVVDMLMPVYPTKFEAEGAALLVKLSDPLPTKEEKEAEQKELVLKKDEGTATKNLTALPPAPPAPTSTETTTTTTPKPLPPLPATTTTTTTTTTPKPAAPTATPKYEPVTPAPGSPPTQRTAVVTSSNSTGTSTKPSCQGGCSTDGGSPLPSGWMRPLVVGKLTGPSTPVIMPTCDCEGDACPHGCSPSQTATPCGDCSDVTLYHCASTCVTKSTHTTPCISDDSGCFGDIVATRSRSRHAHASNRKGDKSQQVVVATL